MSANIRPRTLPVGRSINRGDRFTRGEIAGVWAERRRAILDSYTRTKSYARTALAFGISDQRVRQIVKRFGVGHA